MQPSVLRSARRVLVRLKDRLAVCVQGGLLQGIHFGSDPNAAAFGDSGGSLFGERRDGQVPARRSTSFALPATSGAVVVEVTPG